MVTTEHETCIAKCDGSFNKLLFCALDISHVDHSFVFIPS
ncbi:hypothetical protein URH17368_0507 [Alicyclobacillus hesperidum URH17-3-68]|nr:hypothetical protein URH17368_0507 [Alicyclobacillus hesperidum URH17-3-68]